MGWLQHAIGHHDAAIAHHEQALSLARELDQPIDQARAHDGLAHTYHTLDQPEQARKHWQHALDTLTDLGVDHTDDGTTTAAIHTHLAGKETRRSHQDVKPCWRRPPGGHQMAG